MHISLAPCVVFCVNAAVSLVAVVGLVSASNGITLIS